MSSIVPAPLGPATAVKRGTMSTAHFTKLDALPANASLEARFNAIETEVTTLESASHAAVTIGTGNGLSVNGSQALSLAAAGAAQAGAVTAGAQEFGGAKTLSGAILNGITTIAESVTALVRAVAVSLVLRSSLGAGATDKCVVVGSSETDGGTHASAKLWVAATGIGGTQVDKVYVEKSGSIVFATAAATRIQWGTGANTWQIEATPASGVMRFGNNAVTYFGLRFSDGYGVSAYGFEVNPSGSQATVKTSANGTRIDQRGVDRRGVVLGDDSPGAQAMGINRLASGATTCVITTTQATLASHVEITWLADPAARHWVTLASGSFTVNLSAAPGVNVDFSWRVSGLV